MGSPRTCGARARLCPRAIRAWFGWGPHAGGSERKRARGRQRRRPKACSPIAAAVEDQQMSSLARWFAFVFAAGLLSGCAKDQVSRNVYEGARQRGESLKGTP